MPEHVHTPDCLVGVKEMAAKEKVALSRVYQWMSSYAETFPEAVLQINGQAAFCTREVRAWRKSAVREYRRKHQAQPA